MKRLLTLHHSITLIVALMLSIISLAVTTEAEVTPGPGIFVQPYYVNPHVDGQVINSFDFDIYGQLYYTTGIKVEGVCGPGFTVYRYNGESEVVIYSDENAFGFSGGRIKSYNKYQMLFNDGGTAERVSFNYYMLNPLRDPVPVKNIIDSESGENVIWGLSTSNGRDIWAGGDATSSNSSHIFYGSLRGCSQRKNCNINFIDLGLVGGGSGPLVFDSAGNLYYAQGFYVEVFPNFQNTYIYRFSADEVAAAINDPVNNPLTVTPGDSGDDHVWEIIEVTPPTVPDSQGPLGVASMIVDDRLGLVVTTTFGHDYSQLRRYAVNPIDGSSEGFTVLAESDGRMSEIRYRNNRIYFNDPEGVYYIDTWLSETYSPAP